MNARNMRSDRWIVQFRRRENTMWILSSVSRSCEEAEDLAREFIRNDPYRHYEVRVEQGRNP